MSNPFKLLMSPLTRRFYAGRVTMREGFAESSGQRHDVTGDVWAALLSYWKANDEEAFVINENGKPAYRVSIEKIEDQQ